ncbi:MAG: hypothetical protein HY719_15595 [Planctomycetes bacterium]|nr:hypothetical protein [Planctomycetota bacterium]
MSVPLFDDLKVLDQRDGTFRYERNALDSNKSGAEHKYPEEKKGPEVTAGPGDQKAPQPKPPEPSPEEKRQQGAFSAVLDFLRKMFKDDKLTLRYTVNFPDAVVESADATDHQGKRARWNFTFDDRKTRAARASRMTALYGRKPATSPAPPTSTPAPEGTGQKPREVRAP